MFAVKKDGGITSAADLAGKTVLVQADSSALAALTDEENEEIKALADSFAELREVRIMKPRSWSLKPVRQTL